MSSGEPQDSVGEMLDILVTSTVNTFESLRRFPKCITIQDLKLKLELLTGASPATMVLHLMDKDEKMVSELRDDSATLGSYPVESGMSIHVIDNSIKAGEFEDVSKVEKFELSDEAYSKRSESLRAFKEKHKLGNYNEEEILKKKVEKEQKMKEEEEIISQLSVGSRCEVCVKGQLNRRGTVMFAGKVDFKDGYWVGVKYDEPLGKNDGSVQGKRYFECPPKYGSFVKPHDVTVGNFPEETIETDEI